MQDISYDYTFKILFVGDEQVGKTSILKRITKMNLSQKYQPTIGVDFLTTTHKVNNKLIKCHMWDTAGNKAFHNIITRYFNGSAAVIFVFDLSKERSFNNIDFWLSKYKENKNFDNLCPIFLIGNKCDRERAISKLNIARYVNENNFIYVETSAKYDVNIDSLIKGVIENVYYNTDLYSINNGIQENKKKEKRSRFCCFF
tara:strand:- start:921 stop:1520 length:600 start_codon:yes stop_codon:yes gene_type:complete